MQRGAPLLEKLRIHADVPVTLLCKVLLKTSRVTYYNWQHGSPPRKVAKTRISVALKVLALAIKNGTLPISLDIKGRDRRSTIMQALANSLRQISTRLKQ